MKTWLRTFALALLAAAAPALAIVMPMRVPFQGKLIDPATNNPKNGSVNFVFKIWDAPTGGNTLFTESQTLTVVNGQFTAQIGAVTYLNADILSGTSAYLGVTVGADAEMSPRQPFSMSPYAYTGVQLASDKNIRINAGISYSTFTTAGNLTLQYGVVGTTATFMTVTSTNVGTYGVTTSSGISMGAGVLTLAAASRGLDAQGTGVVATTATFMTVLSTNVGTYSITTSSGISMGAGTLTLDADSRGIDAQGTGIVASTANFTSISTYSLVLSSGIYMKTGTFDMIGSRGINATGTGITVTTFMVTGLAADPTVPAGSMYYNSSSDTYKMLDASGEWNFIYGQTLRRKNFHTGTNTTAVAVNKGANAAIQFVPFYLPGPMVVNSMRCFITTALGAAGDIGVYTSTGGLVLNGGSSSLTTTTGLKSVTPAQAANNRMLPPGQYYAAITFNSTTGRFGGDTLGAAGIISGVGSIATGGGLLLPNTVIPANIVDGTIYFTFEMNQ